MPVTKHSIVLNITGNAKRFVEEFARKLKSAGEAVAGTFRKAHESADPEGLRDAVEDVGEAAEGAERRAGRAGRRGRRRRREMLGGVAGLPGGAGQAVMQAGMQQMAGGRATGVIGAGLQGVGGVVSKALPWVGGAMIGAGIMSKFTSQMTDAFDPILKQFTDIAGMTGEFDLTRLGEKMRRGIAGRAVDPSMVRQIAMVISRATGGPEIGRAAEVGELAKSMGGTAEIFANFVAFQKRYNTGVALEKTTAKGIVSGLKMGHIDEFLQGTMMLQEQLLSMGVAGDKRIGDTLAAMGRIDETLRGRPGAQAMAGIQQQMFGAARGQGPLGGIAMGMLQRRGMDYYRAIRELERGLAGEAFPIIIEELKKMFGESERSAEMVSQLFGVSFTRGEQLLKMDKSRLQEEIKNAGISQKERTKRFRESDTADKLRVEQQRKTASEGWKKTFSDINTSIQKKIVEPSENIRIGIFGTEAEKAKRKSAVSRLKGQGMLGTTGAGLETLFPNIAELTGGAKAAGVETSKSQLANAYFKALQRSNTLDEDPKTINRQEQERAFKMFAAVVERLVKEIQEKDKTFQFELAINDRTAAKGEAGRE